MSYEEKEKNNININKSRKLKERHIKNIKVNKMQQKQTMQTHKIQN